MVAGICQGIIWMGLFVQALAIFPVWPACEYKLFLCWFLSKTHFVIFHVHALDNRADLAMNYILGHNYLAYIQSFLVILGFASGL
jgi:hypothetical protein